MSRSIKKHGFVKDGGKHGQGVKFAKARANKKVRRFSEEIPPKGKFFRKVSQSWDIRQRPNPKGLGL